MPLCSVYHVSNLQVYRNFNMQVILQYTKAIDTDIQEDISKFHKLCLSTSDSLCFISIQYPCKHIIPMLDI